MQIKFTSNLPEEPQSTLRAPRKLSDSKRVRPFDESENGSGLGLMALALLAVQSFPSPYEIARYSLSKGIKT
jgi:hypothetical protein